jgi:hypothetical protein
MTNDVLEWVENAAATNLRDHLQSAEGITREANLTLTALLAALGATFGLAIGASQFRFAAGAMAIFLFVVCVALVKKCLVIKEFPSIANEPKNLMQEGFDLTALRKAELKNMQARIEDAMERNNARAIALNRVRLAAIASPAIFVLATVVLLYATGRVGG